MKTVKLLCHETGDLINMNYDCTPLCVIAEGTDEKKVIADWAKMEKIYRERLLNTPLDVDKITQMKADFIKEFPYFAAPNDADMLVASGIREGTLSIVTIPMV